LHARGRRHLRGGDARGARLLPRRSVGGALVRDRAARREPRAVPRAGAAGAPAQPGGRPPRPAAPEERGGRVTRVSFLVPAHNEERTIAEVLERIEALDLEKEVIVVDDGSTDDTAAIVERHAAENGGVILLRQPNRGKGASVRAAIACMSGEI